MQEKNTSLPHRPFRLATTSFIYPDHIIPIESMPDGVLPSSADVRELGQLSKELDLTYNIHLPTDISLTDPSGAQQARAADTLFRVMELFAPLNPTTCTLHLSMDKEIDVDKDLLAWKKRAEKGLELLVPRLPDPAIISLETLWYPHAFLAGLVTAFDLSLCVDAGHHFKYGHDLKTTFGLHGERISIVHLHGVDFSGPVPKDHIGLDRLPDAMFQKAVKLLSTYEGVVSLEVFNLENLNRSLSRLSTVFGNIPGITPWSQHCSGSAS